MKLDKWMLVDNYNQTINLPNIGYISTRTTKDIIGAPITIIEISNGSFLFTVLPERGMDIGEIRLGSQKMSWDRSEDYLLHPSNVDLNESNGTGWMKGFYGAVAAIGPELFGTPGEDFTLHGSGSYSTSVPESIQVTWDSQSIMIEGKVPVKNRYGNLLFEKFIKMSTVWESSLILREETVTNSSGHVQVLDDGYHIQLSGSFMHQGGRYVLPAKQHDLLIRDSAPIEDNPFHIPSNAEGAYPMRCYQYVPNKVDALHHFDKVAPYKSKMNLSRGLTAEMIVNTENTCAGYVIRPLFDFPRSLIAKQIDSSFMFAIEPCRTRPNRMSQKITDGEALYIQEGETVSSCCIIGLSDSRDEIKNLENMIRSAV
ncbi:aldose 1-epimerase family protein [Paenibacillus endoradicis]|uniref:aldose 1-epimerase family protein n=1 Tax=Paenibacillus endoradicis TaxID=2972487 RepID=UPI002159865A|nr:aldose 1-epimerase family protein [Paenibacillus endoradicis]MCR8657751.1 aldose 1-epimerase family protein [Paenibacillus endoradicis]